MTVRVASDAGPLAALRPLAIEVGATELAVAVDTLAERVRDGRFYVAVLGQFKRGKSTLINALLGERVLPVGVAPVTSVVTIVRRGARGARACMDDRTWESIPIERAAELVSERTNPQNRLGVKRLEVFVPSPLLAAGMCLVDTPGIGSVFEGNTAETRAFVPHVDAAVVVLGADPPISGGELELVEDVARHVHDVLFVLAKADRFSGPELAEARSFTADVLHDRLKREPALFEASAHEVVERGAGTRDWTLLVTRLESLAREQGADLIERAARRGTFDLARRLIADADEQRRALVRPLEETRARLIQVRQCMTDAEQAIHELGFLLQAEQTTVSRRLGAERKRFIDEALPRCQVRLDAAIAGVMPRRGPKLRAAALSLAQGIAEAEVQGWMDRLRPEIERMYRDLGHRFIVHANEFLARLRASGSVPEGSLEALPEESGFRFRSSYYFLRHMRLTTASLWTWVACVARPEGAAQRAARRDGRAFVERLLDTNSARVVNDLDDRVSESRRELEFGVRARLRAVVASAERALARAEASEREGHAYVEQAITRLDRTRTAIAAIVDATAAGTP